MARVGAESDCRGRASLRAPDSPIYGLIVRLRFDVIECTVWSHRRFCGGSYTEMNINISELLPMNISSALELPIPRNQTALMQHLLRLVGVEEHLNYCSASCRISKLSTFVEKMADRYPLTRSARQRS